MAVSGTENISSLLHKVLRRRWMIIVPVVTTMSLVAAYTRSVDLYRSSAIVTFGTEYALADEDQNIVRMFDQKIATIVASLRFGEPLRSIAQKVWPEVDPSKDPVRFNNLAQSVGSGRGLELIARRDNTRALTIAYTSKDPEEAFKIVQATIETLIEEARLHSERRVASSSTFLLQEMEAKRSEIEKLDQEITRLETGFGIVSAPDPSKPSDPKKSTITLSPALLEQEQARDTLKYRDTLPQLQFERTVAEKELERLVNRLEKKEYLEEAKELEGTIALGDDEQLRQIREAVSLKEREKQTLISQGILERHPKRRSLEAELRNLSAQEQSRRKELAAKSGQNGLDAAQLAVERKLRTQISEKSEQLAQIKDKIAVLEHYQEQMQSQKDTIVSQLDVLSVTRSRLESLKRQKAVAVEAYQQTVTELEIIRRHGRLDEGDIGMRIAVAEEPEVPKAPIPYAHMSTVVMAFFLSFAFGVCAICAIDAVDNSLSSPTELRAVVPVPVIGEVDRMVSAESRAYFAASRLAVVAFLLFVIAFSNPIVRRFFL